MRTVDALWTDVRHALRRLRRAPVFSAVVILTLACASGANTTVLSLLNAIVLSRVAVHEPHRLVTMSTTDTRNGQQALIHLSTFRVFRDRQHSLSSVSMYINAAMNIEARGTYGYVGVEAVTGQYFSLVGAPLAAGRGLTEEDDDPAGGGARVVVITDRFWRRMFGADPQALGETVKLDGSPVTIVGVTAAGFDGLQVEGGVDLFLPVATMRTLRGDPRGLVRALRLVGRLAPGVTVEQSRAELQALWPAALAETAGALPPADRSAIPTLRVDVESLAHGLSALRLQYGSSILAVGGLTATLLAIGCLNLAALMLARALAREHELRVHLALGVGRLRLARQSMIEGLLVSLAGLALALPLAWWSTEAVRSLLTTARATPLKPLTPDARALGIAAAVAILTGLVVGALPALRAMRQTAGPGLAAGRTVAGGPGRAGRLLLIAQVAISMLLVVGAGLFGSTLAALEGNGAQFRGRPIVWTRLARNPAERGQPLGPEFFRTLHRQLAAIPGADGAAYSILFPSYLGFPGALPTDGFARAEAADGDPTVAGLTELVSPGFFELFGIARLQGRDFTWADDANAPPVGILSRSLAERLFPAGDAIGRRVRIGTTAGAQTDVEIIGVAADAPIGLAREPRVAVVFRPMLQDLSRAQFPLAHVRARGDVRAVQDAYVRVVSASGRYFVPGLFTLDGWLDFALLRERLVSAVASSSAALALALACLGIYGLLSYAVSARVREIGVRLSLGATPADILRMIVRDGLRVVGPGVLIGLPLALASARLVRSLLYGVPPAHAPVLAASAAILAAAGVAAALIPARRASAIDPAVALRQE